MLRLSDWKFSKIYIVKNRNDDEKIFIFAYKFVYIIKIWNGKNILYFTLLFIYY